MGGFLDRLHNVVTGIGGAVQAPVGLVWDLARAPFVDDEMDGILGTFNATITSRTGQLFGNAFGPEEGVGAILGGIPAPIRGPVSSGLIQPVLGGLETAYREGVAEPLSTSFTAGSLADAPGGGGLAGLLDPDIWREADRIAEHRSPGQALALLLGTKDITDQEEVERFAATDAYQTASGSLDALARIFLSPDIVAAKAGLAFKAGRLTAARGGPIGAITEVTPPQIGARAERFGSLALGRERITAINNQIDRAYLRLPESLQKLMGSERTFAPEDVGRLERFEATRRELQTGVLEERVQRSSDPTRIRVMQNVAESRRTREARIGTGATTTGREAGTVRRRVAAQAQADIDAYFAAATNPAPKGMFSGITTTPGWKRVDDLIETFPTEVDVRAGMIRDRLFPDHPRGDIIGQYLAEAQGPAEREGVMRVFLGDMRALRSLEKSNYAMAARLQDLAIEQATIRAEGLLAPITGTPTPSFFTPDSHPIYDDVRNNEERLARIGEEIDAVVTESARNERLSNAFKSLPAGPSYTRRQQLRNAYKSSAFYQTSHTGKAVRLISDMRPHHMVDSGDTNADAQLARMLREANFGDEEILRARGQFMARPVETRGADFERWVERVERGTLKEYGLSPDEIDEVLAHAHIGKNQAKALIRGAKYDGAGRARVQFHDGDEILDIELPLSVTQLQNVVNVPNFHLLRKHAERYARLKYGDDWRSAVTRGASPAWTTKEYGLDAMRGIMEVWRPAVLLRPAWTIRVVGDEQLRQLAKFGALSVMLEGRQNLHNYAAELKSNPIVRRVFRTDDIAKAGQRGAFVNAVAGGAVAGPMGAVAGGALGNRIVRKMAQAEERGFRNFRFGGHSISGPFGDAGSTAEFYKVMNSARQTADELFGRHEGRFIGALRRDPSRWRTYTWGESAQANAVYRREWARNVRRQIGQDDMGKQFLAGKNADEVLDWMDNTLQGRAYASKVPWRSDHRAWVEAYADHIESYTGGLDEVKHGILTMPDRDVSGTGADIKVEQLLDRIPEHQRAPIHGAETDQLMASSPLNQAINSFVDNSFDILGTLATDSLSRNPTFARFYNAEARRLFAGLEPGRVPENLITKLEGQARDFALRETRQLLYDLAEQSRFASMTRLLMPFYPAWQEVLTRWAGLVVENPVFAVRAKEVWQAPDRAGWTYRDDRGNNFLRIRIPEFARGLVNQGVFHSALDSQGYLFLDKKGFNLVAQGTPGFGPFVQVAVSEMVKKNPSIEDSVRFILPFGPQEPMEALLPPIAKRFMAASSEEGAARANAEARILTTKLAQMETGEIPEVDFNDPAARQAFLDQIDAEADQLMKLRLFTGFVSPVAPIYESPYKPYIDIYRALRDGDWQRAKQVGQEFDVPGAENLPSSAPEGATGANASITADDIFIDTFGEEFFSLTQAFTESVNGVPPTVEGLEASQQFGDLISAYPEWGGVIAGYDGGGAAVKFSRAVYDRQLADGSRRRLTIDEVLDGPDKRLGWATYSRYMDMIEMLRIERGLPNMQVAGAEDLRNLKRTVIMGLATKYPSWYEDYSVTDRNAWAKKIEGAKALVADERLAGRPDIQGLAEYLRARDAITAVLGTRTSTALDSTANQDLVLTWQTIVASILERNPAFADLFYRKLERDPLDIDAGGILVSNSGQVV